MADAKLSALTELNATPADTDEVYIRDVSEAAADESKRITVANLLGGVAAADYPEKLKPNITRWVLPGWFVNGAVSVAVSSGVIYYTPIFIEETTTYIRIGLYVGTGVAGNADLRIFNWSAGLPDSLVLSAGTVSTAVTGTYKEITISQQLTRGYYFLAVRYDATPSIHGVSPGSGVSLPVGSAGDNGRPAEFRPVLTVTASFADPAPTPTSSDFVSKAQVVLREN